MTAQPKTVYADNNATTAIKAEVLESMMPYLTTHYGNAASVHSFGHQLMNVLDRARQQVADLLHADAKDEITFTSGGTESNNTAIRSIAASFPEKRHVVTSAIEHSSVGNVLLDLELNGYEVTRIPVDRAGHFDLSAFETSIRADTALVSIMWANNETGTVLPVDRISQICRKKGVLFHCDTVQAAGKVPIDLGRVPVDFLSISAHKLHGPKGVGVLYARKGIPFIPFMRGGSQQDGRRAGTENVAGIVGLGESCKLASRFLADAEEVRKLEQLRDRLENGLLKQMNHIKVSAKENPRLPNTSGIVFEGVDGEALLQLMSDRGIFASSGSACTAGTVEPSHVLLAMGFSERDARSAVRFSLSSLNTQEEIDYLIAVIPELVERVRKFSPLT